MAYVRLPGPGEIADAHCTNIVLYCLHGPGFVARGHLQDGAEQGARRGPRAVPLDGQPVPRLHALVPLLLRAGVPPLPRPRASARTSPRRSSSRRTWSRCCGASSPSPRWPGDPVAMGTATDPYQHCEGRYRLTRGVVEALRGLRNPMSMLTKSTMVVRDLDLFCRLAEVAETSVAMSVGTLDEDVRKVVEPGTPPGRKRLEILGRFAAAGIRTFVLVAPVLPGLTDDDGAPRGGAGRGGEGGHPGRRVIPLHVRPGIRDHFVPWLRGRVPAAGRPLRAALRHPRLRAARVPGGALRAVPRAARQARPRRHGHRPGRPAPRSERGQLALAV